MDKLQINQDKMDQLLKEIDERDDIIIQDIQNDLITHPEEIKK